MKKYLSFLMNRYVKFIAIALLTCYICLIFSSTPLAAKSPDWIVRSNTSAELLSEASQAEDCRQKLGVSKSLIAINSTFQACRQKSILNVVKTLEQKLNQAKNPELHLDLEILLKAGRQRLRSYELYEKYRVPYIDLSQAILESLEDTLAEEKSSSKQQQAILAKLKQYAGLEPGKTALVTSLKQKIQAQLQKSEFMLPSPKQLEPDLENNASQVLEILKFLRQQEVPDYQEAYAELKTQLFDYETFMRSQVLTKAKESVRIPPELYAFELERQGIEIPVKELIQQGHTAFTQIQGQMDEMAQQIAKQRGIEVVDYREMIQILKQEQLSAQETLDLYQKRAKDIEAILEREDLVTLPEDKFNIRLATTEEKKNSSVLAFYDNFSSTVVLPVFSNPKKAKNYNDINNPATSWGLMVHEGRPGHDLQFATVYNSKLSRARTGIKNTSNIEGWATYVEKMMQPYFPLEGQFITLRLQLIRAAQAFIYPELQLGYTTVADAKEVWIKDTGFAKHFIESEFATGVPEFPGRQSAYFHGSQQLLRFREQAEEMLGEEFTPKKFHDFVLSQGFLTPKLLERALNEKWGNVENR